MKLQSTVPVSFCSEAAIDHNSSVLLLGSCFLDGIATRFRERGFNVLCNPFGPLYNPLSLEEFLRRTVFEMEFTESDCTTVGGTDYVCSHSFHTLAAKATTEEFLQCANETQKEVSTFIRQARDLVVILSLGTSYVYEKDSQVVANCLKRPASEFTRRRLTVEEVNKALERIHSILPGARFILSVCPVRHFSDGARENNVSKGTLHLAIDQVEYALYFPFYEIQMDELRDYRFYARDLFHPSDLALDVMWERFSEYAFTPATKEKAEACYKEFLYRNHKPLLK